MNRLIAILLISASFLFFGCTPKADNSPNVSQENLVLATIWFQHSPEAKALFHQGFNIAKERVMEHKKLKSDRPLAVVVDLDETMIDNSPFQAKLVKVGAPYTSQLWDEWVQRQEARATPGAVEFSQFCQTVGVDVIYLSNRTQAQLEATMLNMQQLGFAFLDSAHFYMKETTSGKEPRRALVSEKFEIILLLGDNLSDFAECFEQRGTDWGTATVEQFREEFGRKFIVFPNPLYGDWEKNIYGNRTLTMEERSNARHEVLEAY